MNNENLAANNNSAPPVNVQADTFVFHSEPRAVNAGEGIKWIRQSWSLVKEKLTMWIMLNIVYLVMLSVIFMGYFFIILIGLSFSTLMNPFFITLMNGFLILLTYFIMPFFNGGIVAICENQRKTGQVKIGLLFAGLRKKFGALFVVGIIDFAVNLTGMIIDFITGGSDVFIFTGSAIFSLMMASEQYYIPSDTSLLSDIITSVAAFAGIALIWFAPALIMNHDFKVGTAIFANLQAVKKNILPGILCFIVLSILVLISLIPLGLGLLISVPVMYVCYYSSYRSLFFYEAKPVLNSQAHQNNSIIQ